MRILKVDKEKVVVECTKEDIKAVCYVGKFVVGGVEADIEIKMLKIVGVLEGALQDNEQSNDA